MRIQMLFIHDWHRSLKEIFIVWPLCIKIKPDALCRRYSMVDMEPIDVCKLRVIGMTKQFEKIAHGMDFLLTDSV